jgi:hypothetical protein
MEVLMSKLWIVVAALAAAALPSAANAVVCYTLLDKGDNVLYQDTAPPFDMSDSGAALRTKSRQRNEYLLVYEMDSCPTVLGAAGSASYRPATVEEIVSGMRAYASAGRGPTAGAGRIGGGVTPSQTPARSGSTGTRSGY